MLTKENPKLLELDIVETPSFISAYNETKSSNMKEIDWKFAFKLYDTYGIDEENIKKISVALDKKFDSQSLVEALEWAKSRSKTAVVASENKIYTDLVKEGIPKTDDSFKYVYLRENGKYDFPSVDVKIFKIFNEDKEVTEIEPDYFCSLLLDKTNFYSEAGGQISDKGVIKFGEDIFDVSSVDNANGYVFHKGFFESKQHSLRTGAKGVLSLDEDFRLNCMRNHTCTHLLNTALKKHKGVTCQKSSKVTNSYLSFDVAIFGDKLTTNEVEAIEEDILSVVRNDKPVETRVVNSQELLDLDGVTLIPGEVYPENGIRLIEVIDENILSR